MKCCNVQKKLLLYAYLCVVSMNAFAGGIIQDINVLKSYYLAVSRIRQKLEPAAKKLNYETWFNVWQTPNPFHARTPQYMFLETDVFKDAEEIRALYTPFGMVGLLSEGNRDIMLRISKEFLTGMDWELQDVSDTVHSYNYSQDGDRRYGPFPFKKESKKVAGTPSKLYLIKRVGSIDFMTGGSPSEELVIFPIPYILPSQHEQDKAQFNELSNGKNCF